jgi:hypothetical protein
MKVQIENVDIINLLKVAKGEEFANHFSQLLTSITALGQGATAIPAILDTVLKQVL